MAAYSGRNRRYSVQQHSAGMVLNQPALPKAEWQAEVDKMRAAYKAPIDDKDVDEIIDYLVKIKGAN